MFKCLSSALGLILRRFRPSSDYSQETDALSNGYIKGGQATILVVDPDLPGLVDRVASVTGGEAGIGRSHCTKLADLERREDDHATKG